MFLIIILLTLASYDLSAFQKASKLLNVTTEEVDSHFKLIINADGFIKDYNTFSLVNPARLVIDLPLLECKIPKKMALNNPFYPQLRCETDKNILRLVVDSTLSSVWPYKIKAKDNKLVIVLSSKKTKALGEVKAPSSPISKGAAPLAPEKTGHRKVSLSTPTIIFPGTQQVFKGQLISIDFQDADIRQVLRIIAEVSGLNIVVSDKVKGKVTLRLEKVPWDQVLDIILQTYQLGMIKKGNVIRIVPIEQLKKEQQMLIEAKEALQKKEKVEPLITREIQINYGKAADFIKQIDEIKSDRGKVTYDEFTNRIIMTDTSGRIKKAKALIKSLDIPPRQVMIEARIVEVSTDFARELGIQWGGGYERGSSVNWQSLYGGVGTTSTTSTLGGENQVTLGEKVIKNFPLIVSLPTAGYGGIGFTLGRLGKATKLGLDIKLQAMESLGVVHILSTPKVITMDNQEAVISQGEEIPYHTVSELGTRTEFREAVLKLTVTPHITPDKRVRMDLKVNKDSRGKYDPSMDALPIDKKVLETKLLVNDGETVVIGGIITEEKSRTVQRVPFFSRIPILGLLFRNKIVSTTKKELMIFITPTLVVVEQGV